MLKELEDRDTNTRSRLLGPRYKVIYLFLCNTRLQNKSKLFNSSCNAIE